MHGMTDSPLMLRINAQCHTPLVHPDGLSIVVFPATDESPPSCKPDQATGLPRQINTEELADSVTLQLLT